MYADPCKYLGNEPEHLYHVKAYLPGGETKEYSSDKELINTALNDCDGTPYNGRWYWIGIDNFIDLCNKYNYSILDKDLNIDKTNPITLFTKL